MTCEKYRLLLHELLDGHLPRRTAMEMAEHEATCPVCLAYREEMYVLLQNLHTLDADIEPPDELSISWRQMIRMEKPAKPRIDTSVRIWVAIAALLVIVLGGATLVHMGVIPGREDVPEIRSGILPAIVSGTHTDTTTGNVMATGDSALLKATGGQKILRSGSFKIRTNRFDDDMELILGLVQQYSGYAQYEAISGDPLTTDGRGGRFCKLEIRVPEPMLGGFVRALSSVVEVTDSELVAQDYTDQYAEMTTKLAAYQEQLDRFKGLLNQMQTIDEKMTIEVRISDIETQMSSLQGMLQNWDSKEAFSQVDIGIQETDDVMGLSGLSMWERMRTQFGKSAEAVGSYFVDMAVFLMMAAPWILVVVALAGAALLVEKLNWRSRQL